VPPPGAAVVLGLPRGGIPVAAPIAQRLEVPVRALAVRKVGAPGRPELAVGAVARIGDRVEVYRNPELLARLGLDDEAFAAARDRAVDELAGVVARFGTAPELTGRAVIVVDDGLATGATMLAAVRAIGCAGPARIVVAVPVAADDAVAALRPYAEVICPRIPRRFVAVGQAYDDFEQVDDAEVLRLLGRG
jgi:putative phosphoribosyl transferase